MDVVSETVRSARLNLIPFSAVFLRASLAAKFDFRKIGSHIDEEDGLEKIYERVVP